MVGSAPCLSRASCGGDLGARKKAEGACIRRVGSGPDGIGTLPSLPMGFMGGAGGVLCQRSSQVFQSDIYSEEVRPGDAVMVGSQFNGGNRARRAMPGSASFNRRNPWIFVGTLNGVRRARGKPGSLVAPLDLDPASVIWPVTDLEVVVVITTDAQRQFAARLGGCLVRDGARVALVLGSDSGRLLSRHVNIEEVENA